MTMFSTTCYRCDSITLTQDDIYLELDEGGRTGMYRFTCPLCGDEQRRPANEEIVAVLLEGDCRYEIARTLLIGDEAGAFFAQLENMSTEEIMAALEKAPDE